jgi:hypothetical protein
MEMVGERTCVTWLDCGVFDAIGIGRFLAGHINGCCQGCESQARVEQQGLEVNFCGCDGWSSRSVKRREESRLEGGSDVSRGGRGNANMDVCDCATYAYVYTDL